MPEQVASPSLAERLAGLEGTTVTFVFTDIEDSTPLLKQLGEQYAEVSAEHRRLLRATFGEHGGIEVDTQGDAFFFVFRRARDAATAAVDAQRGLAEHAWPDGVSLRVRMGMNSGEPLLHEEGLVGLSVVRGSRICAAGHGGQVLLSESSASLLRDHMPEGMALQDLGVHPLKGLDDPQRLFQLKASGLASDFPSIRVAPRRGRRRLALVGGAVGLAAAAAVAAVFLFGGSSSPITVPPNSLAEIDPEAGRVTGYTTVGKSPVGVAYTAGKLWVANADDASVFLVAPANDRVQPISLGRPADAHPVAISAGKTVWVALGVERQLQQLDRQFVGQTVGEPVATGEEPLSVLVVGNRVCAAVTIRVVCFDAQTGRPAGSTPIIDNGATALAFGAGTLWVGGSDAVTQVAPGALDAQGTTIPVPGRVTGIAVGGGSIWVAAVASFGGAQGAGTLSRIALGSSALSSTFELQGQPTGIAYGEGSVWLTVDDSTLLRIDPESGAVVETIDVGGAPSAVVVGGGSVWAPVR